MSHRTTIGRFGGLLLLLLLVNVVAVSLASEESSVTVVNKTSHYIHVVVDGESYLYVGPGHSATHTTPAKATVLVSAFYSPGQGVSGAVLDTVDVPYRPAREGCTCTDESNGPECVYNPPVGGSVRYDVYPEDLDSED